jgi:polyhydroxyalkanoate synthesis regulator phasin
MDEAKYRYWQAEYSDLMIESVTNDLVLEYEEGVAGEVVDEFIVEQDYVSQLIEQWINDQSIYLDTAKAIVENLDFDIFEEHEYYEEKPKDWFQACEWALELAIHTDDNIQAIYKMTNEKLQRLWKK